MKLTREIIEKIKKEPVLFSQILLELNKTEEVLPATLLQRLERNSRLVTENITVATFLQRKGYGNSELFESIEVN